MSVFRGNFSNLTCEVQYSHYQILYSTPVCSGKTFPTFGKRTHAHTLHIAVFKKREGGEISQELNKENAKKSEPELEPETSEDENP